MYYRLQFHSEILIKIYQYKLLFLFTWELPYFAYQVWKTLAYSSKMPCNIILDVSRETFNELEVSSIILFHITV